ncbi:hypothetical protein CANMA_003807 [Candida margitis]|uniref:uncharacterized protein n=1 Tax=Candida margitis TaxID=1775924 RepID=UPI0022280869|nr:uncharacterized protein CANMA_003807 [Candida margitis]KAI5961287.1 hypothetical protein CANMA_003807 [Candida margitis]
MNSHTDARQQRRSLLSTSLAGEKNFSASIQSPQQQQQQQQQPEMYFQQSQQEYHPMSHEHPILCINEENDRQGIRYAEHPEPQLLASSVGKDLNGKLIPSSSTISLLSLNQDMSSKFNEQQYQQQQQQQSSFIMPKSSRTTSYSNLQRLQPYQRSATMSPPVSQSYSHQQQLLSIAASPDGVSLQPLEIPTANNNTLLSNPGTVPNSPNLDPVSLGGSPSRFWLSSQTPPSSATYIMKSRTGQQVPLLSSSSSSSHSQAQYVVHKSAGGSIYEARNGDDSPVLNPVQTPTEDPPMTPLFLSTTNNLKHVDYFSHYHPNQSDLKEDVSEEEKEEEKGEVAKQDDKLHEEEHNITRTQPQDTQRRGRNHETLSGIIDSFIHPHQTNHATTATSTLDASFADSASSLESLSAALNQLRTLDNSEVADSLLNILDSNPKQKGVNSEFLDTLERVPVSQLSDDEFCPICTNRFKEDKYPLIVKLPCGVKNSKHFFDLECVGPWLMTNSTCPMCRTNVLEVEENRRKRIEEEIRKAREEDSEEEAEEGWDVYG